MEYRYYLLDAETRKTAYKQRRPIDLSDLDTEKFLIARETSRMQAIYNQYGFSDDANKAIFTRVPFALKEETEEILNKNKFVVDEDMKVYEITDVRMESLSNEYLYIIGLNEVKNAV